MGALSGVKILDFSTLLPGPFATLYLSDMGADVLRVEAPDRPALDTYSKPLVECEGACSGLSATVTYLGRNKRSIALNLKSEEGREIVYKLVKDYDVVIDQFRPGVMDKMGIGYEQLKKINPKLIYVALTGYGQDGPMALKAGHDLNYIARSGFMSYSGRKSEGPAPYGIQIADVCGGSFHTIIGVLAALLYRERTGKGQFVDVSMFDAALALNTCIGAHYLYEHKYHEEAHNPQSEDQMLNGGGLYDFYETKDGRYLSMGAVEPKFFANFCTGIGRPDLIQGYIMPKDPTVKEQIREIMKTKDLDEWVKIFDGVDACVEPVQNLKEALTEDEHVKARGLIINVPVENGAGATVPQVALPIKMSESPAEYKYTGCLPGYHTKEVLLEIGMTEEEYDKYKAAGVFGKNK